MQKAVTLFFTLVHLTRLPPERPAAKHRLVEEVCSRRASFHNLLTERRLLWHSVQHETCCSSVWGELS